MLVDIVVRNHKVIGAKSTKAVVAPIILIRTESGEVIPRIKWIGNESHNWSERLEYRIFGTLKGEALKQALKIVKDNGGLDISGEYGSIEILDSDFEPEPQASKAKEEERSVTEHSRKPSW